MFSIFLVSAIVLLFLHGRDLNDALIKIIYIQGDEDKATAGKDRNKKKKKSKNSDNSNSLDEELELDSKDSSDANEISFEDDIDDTLQNLPRHTSNMGDSRHRADGVPDMPRRNPRAGTPPRAPHRSDSSSGRDRHLPPPPRSTDRPSANDLLDRVKVGGSDRR